MFDAQSLSDLVKAYLNTGNITSLINSKVQNTIDILNHQVFRRPLVSSANINMFANLIEEKVLK